MKKPILKLKEKDTSISLKKIKIKNIKLPKIESSKNKSFKTNGKLINYTSNQIGDNSTSSILSKSSLKNKVINNNSVEEKIEPKSSTQKINEIINDVNKSHNFNTKVINNVKKVDIKNKLILKDISSSNKDISTDKNINIKKIKIKNYIDKPKYIFISQKKINSNISEDSSLKNNNDKIMPRITKEKLKEIQEKRKKRLLQEKKENEIQTKMLEDIKEKKEINKKQEIEFSCKINSPIEITRKKAQNILVEAGMIDAYKYLIEDLCKKGLPLDNLYEYSADVIKNYEKEWKKKKSKMLKEKIDKYFENKKKLYLSNENSINRSIDNLKYNVLKKREQEQFLKKLDKSRSALHILKRIPKKENKKDSNNNKNNENINNPLNIINNEGLNSNNKIDVNDDTKVYFNINIKNNEVKINEKINDNKKEIISNQNNEKRENIDKKKEVKIARHSMFAFKRGNHKLSFLKNNLKSFKSSKNLINDEIIEEEENNINNINSNNNFGNIKSVKTFSKNIKIQ